MPVFYTPIPQNLRVGLANVSGPVHFRDPYQDHEVCAEVSSHLPLQMLLYFNIFFFPFWWISEVLMLHLKCTYDQCLLVTEMVLINIFEVLRVYLGYVGNLKEKVPELAGFWLILFLFQLLILCFFISDEDTIIPSLELAVHSLYLGFLLASFLALCVMTRKLTQQFHMRQFGPVQGLHTAEVLPLFGLPYGGRSVLPVRDIQPR
uniref:Zgc:112294 n=1 Tax=Cyprinus carpio TaxID=7962 RepID=A0A8C2D5X4_CYPCA